MSKSLSMLALSVAYLISSSVQAATLATFEFNGNTNATYGTGVNATGLNFGANGYFASGLSNVGFNANRYATDNHPSATALDLTKYTGFNVTVGSGFRLDLATITFSQLHERTGNSSTTGPKRAEARLAFGSTQLSTGEMTIGQNATTGTLNANTSLASETAASFRHYGYDAPRAASDLWLDAVTLNGELVALARMTSAVSNPTASRVIVGASDASLQYQVNLTNTATGGTQQEALNYSIGGTGLASPSPAVSPLAGNGATRAHSVAVDTTTAGQKNTTLSVSATNAFSTTGTTTGSKTVDVLDHSNAAFANIAGDATVIISNAGNNLTLDFGTVSQGASGGSLAATFDIANLIANGLLGAAFTAGLDLDSIIAGLANSSGVGLTGDSTFTALAGGGTEAYSVAVDTNSIGSFAASYEFKLSDENLLGGTAAQSETLTLNILGTVIPVPEPASAALMGVGLLMVARRRGR